MESHQRSDSPNLVQNPDRNSMRTLVFQSAMHASERNLGSLMLIIVYYILKLSILVFYLLKSSSSEIHLRNFVFTSISTDLICLFILLHKIRTISNNESSEMKIISQLNELYYLISIYVINQIYGNYYYYSCDICEDVCPLLNKLAFYLIILGYIKLVLPCLLLCCVIMCLHVLIIIIARTAPSQQHPATEEVINSLPCNDYKPGGDVTECSICTDTFKSGDRVCTLPCGSQHVFHEECIKNWIKINSVCPMCRTPIQ